MSKRTNTNEDLFTTPLKKPRHSLNTPGLYNPGFVSTLGVHKAVSAFDAFPAKEFNSWINNIKGKAINALQQNKALDLEFVRARQLQAEQEANRVKEREELSEKFAALAEAERVEIDRVATMIKSPELAYEFDKHIAATNEAADAVSDESQEDSRQESEMSNEEGSEEENLFSEESDAEVNGDYEQAITYLESDDQYSVNSVEEELLEDEESEEGEDLAVIVEEESSREAGSSEDSEESAEESDDVQMVANELPIAFEEDDEEGQTNDLTILGQAATDDIVEAQIQSPEDLEDEKYRIWQEDVTSDQIHPPEQEHIHPHGHTVEEYVQESAEVPASDYNDLEAATQENFDVVLDSQHNPVSISERPEHDEPLDEAELEHIHEEEQFLSKLDDAQFDRVDFPDDLNLEMEGSESDSGEQEADEADDLNDFPSDSEEKTSSVGEDAQDEVTVKTNDALQNPSLHASESDDDQDAAASLQDDSTPGTPKRLPRRMSARLRTSDRLVHVLRDGTKYGSDQDGAEHVLRDGTKYSDSK